MAFKTGHTKVGGRRAGVPNKGTAELRQWAAQVISDPVYQKRLRERLLSGEAGRMEMVLWQYACGKPAGEPDGADPFEKFAVTLDRILNRQERGENESSTGLALGVEPSQPQECESTESGG